MERVPGTVSVNYLVAEILVELYTNPKELRSLNCIFFNNWTFIFKVLEQDKVSTR